MRTTFADADIENLIREGLELVTAASRCHDRAERLRLVATIRQRIELLRAWSRARTGAPSELHLRASSIAVELAQSLGRLPGVRTFA